MEENDIREFLRSLGVNSLLDEPKGKKQKNENMDMPRKELPPMINYGFDPAMMPVGTPLYMGAPMSGMPISVMGGASDFQGQGSKGTGYGGRLGAELQLSPEQILALGVSGRGTNMRYGMGNPYGGAVNRADITGIDATLMDLARNQQFGAELKKGMRNDPFISLFYRKMFD